MMEARGPSSPFDFETTNMEDFNIGDFVLSPATNDPVNTPEGGGGGAGGGAGGTDDFMSSFSLPSPSSRPLVQDFSHDSTESSSKSYAPISISQLQQIHSQLSSQHNSPSAASPSAHVQSNQNGQQQQQPSESELQSILDGIMANASSPVGGGGLVDAGNSVDLASMLGMSHTGQLAAQAAAAFSAHQQQGEDTATALQRLQQLQQLQHFQSQFIQQQLDQLTRQAVEQQKQQQQFQPPLSIHQLQQHSPHLQQHQQGQSRFRSQSINSLEHLNPNLHIQQGLPTPAHSSELYATMHQEMVSPIHMPGGAGGMYRDSNEYDLDGNLLFTPLMSPAMSQSNQTTPGSAFQPFNPLSHAPNSDLFSPLTSPALGPVFHSSDYNNHVSSSHLHNHPPSMSPHLLAQTSSLSMSPHLLAQQSGSIPPASPTAAKRTTSSSGKSRSSRGAGSSTVGAGGGPEGKVAKARPSPLMKPTNSMSTLRRKKDASNGGTMPSPMPLISPSIPLDGIGELEMSEAAMPNQYYPHPSPAMNSNNAQQHYFPPSAIPNNIDHNSSGSNNSPSPVDLASLQMPPPPVPTQQQRRLSSSSNFSSGSGSSSMVTNSIAPQTPATFLNLSRANISSGFSSTTATSTTPANPSPLSSPFISATDPSHYRNGQSHQNGANEGGSVPRGSYKPPFIAPVAKGKTPGAASKGTRKAQGSKGPDRPRPPPPSKPDPSSASSVKPPEVRKTSHREAEQRRRDSLKAGFDELRVLLPPINVEAFDPDTGEPIAGASMPRLPARSPLIPDDNPNRGVSKVALLRCSNKHIGLLNGRIQRRDEMIERLKREVRELRMRSGVGWNLVVGLEEGDEEDLLDVDVDFVEREDEDEYDDEEEEEEEEEEEDQPATMSTKSRRGSTTTTNTKSKPATMASKPRTSMGRAAAQAASAKLREGSGEGEEEGMDQS